MKHSKVKCPECNKSQTINNNGEYCELDVHHWVVCKHCEEEFTIMTNATYTFKAFKLEADQRKATKRGNQ